MPDLDIWSLSTNGVEKTFRQWGILMNLECFRTNKGKSTVTLSTVENFDATIPAQFSAYSHATINRNGQPWFKGYFDDPKMRATGSSQSITYQIHNVWWLFEQNHFRQYRNQFVRFSKTNQRVLGTTVDQTSKGAGYKIGDALTLVGGAGTAATFLVVAIGPLGEVALVWASNGGGNYTVTPGATAAVNGGSGGGLRLKLTYQPAPITAQVITSEVFLGENLHAVAGYAEPWPNGTGDQIGEIIDWINSLDWASVGMAGPVCQKGIMDPHTHMPITRVNSLFASEAITNVLRWEPDAVVVIDDATEPPTVNVRKLGKWDYTTTPPTFKDYTNLPEVAIDITADQEEEIGMSSTISKRWSGVLIYYKSVNTFDGAIYPQTITDAYPAGTTDKTPFALSQTVELMGSHVSHQLAIVSVNTDAPFSLLSGNAAQQLTWWTAHDKSLSDPNIDPTTLKVTGPVTVVDNNGNPISGAFNQELLDSAIPPWAGQAIRAHISQIVSYKRYTNAAHTVEDTSPNNKRVVKTILLTNAQGGLYRALSSISTAEPVPQNVAESAYRTLAAQQWMGTVTFVDAPLRSDISLGVRLKLIGPTQTFSNLVVQSIRQFPATGKTTVEFGPGPLIDIDTWIEFSRASRGRITWDLPSGRGDGGVGASQGSGEVDTTATVATNDTSHGVGGHGYDSVSAPV